MSILSPNSYYPNNGPITLEPIKSVSQENTNSAKTNFVPNNLLLNFSGNTVVRIKKKYENSMDFVEPNQDITPKSPGSYRSGFIGEDGSLALAKPNRSQKRESGGSSYSFSSAIHGGPSYQKIEMIDTCHYPFEDKKLSSPVERLQGTPLNMISQPRVLSKVNIYSSNFNKKASADLGKERWSTTEGSPLKKPSKEEVLEKTPTLPALEVKPKFPKDVFFFKYKKEDLPLSLFKE